MSCITSLDELILASGETINFSMDFTKSLETGITISTPIVTSNITGVTLGTPSVVSPVVYFTISSSTVGRYMITVQVSSSDGQTILGKGHLRVS